MDELKWTDVTSHAMRLAYSRGGEYEAERDDWDLKSIEYFWAALREINNLKQREAALSAALRDLWAWHGKNDSFYIGYPEHREIIEGLIDE